MQRSFNLQRNTKLALWLQAWRYCWTKFLTSLRLKRPKANFLAACIKVRNELVVRLCKVRYLRKPAVDVASGEGAVSAPYARCDIEYRWLTGDIHCAKYQWPDL
jgi:hypothetical protein